MQTLFLLGAMTFLLSLFLTPLVRNRFRRNSLSTALRIGGIPVASACLISYALVPAIGLSNPIWPSESFILRLLGAALFVFVIGMIDDLKRIEPWHRIVFQIIAGGL